MSAVRAMRLNEMQRLMRCCAEVAPYNFVHAVRLAGAAEMDHWRGAVAATLREFGLGVPTFHGAVVCFADVDSVRIEISSASIDEQIIAELNRPFLQAELPLRFFVVEETDATHWFGLCVDHWLADDHACRNLLHAIFSHRHGLKNSASPAQLASDETSPATRRLKLFSALPDFARQVANHRAALRVPLREPLDFTVRAFRKTLPDGLIDRIAAHAKKNGATVHDVFLFAATKTFGSFFKTQLHGKRDGIGLVTVMDLRRGGPDELQNAFSCNLGSFTTVVRRTEDISSVDLLARISAQTKARKARADTSLGAMGIARLWWNCTRSRKAKATLFQRGTPLVCGLSNVNLTRSWIAEAAPRVLDFRRIGPAGPVAPMTWMITTLGSRLSVEVTYRTTAFCQRDAEALADDFCARLVNLENPTRGV